MGHYDFVYLSRPSIPVAFHRRACFSSDLTPKNKTHTHTHPTRSLAADTAATVEIPIEQTGRTNGLVCWMDYALDADTCVSTGPTVPGAPSYHRPSVRFLNHIELAAGGAIKIDARFTATNCDVALRVLPHLD